MKNLWSFSAQLHKNYTERKRDSSRNGAQSRNRTNDTGIFSPLLYQLSYLGPCDLQVVCSCYNGILLSCPAFLDEFYVILFYRMLFLKMLHLQSSKV